MRALEIDSDLKYHIKDVAMPRLEPGGAIVKLKGAALNHRDVWIGEVSPICALNLRKGLYPGLKVPCILGSDGVGQVISVQDPKDK